MADHSGSTRFRARFEAALQDYEKKAGVTLASHPLAVQLQSCHSVESVTTALQSQAPAFGELQGSDRVIKSIKGIVSILSGLSVAPSLGDATGLVRHKALMTYLMPLTVSIAIPTGESSTRWFCYPT
jgi:hypothetical protein